MLTELSGQTVEVVSAVCMIYSATGGKQQERCFDDSTKLFMDSYDSSMIDAYLDQTDYTVLAGGLAYQSGAFLMIKGIQGCFYNVVGFPAPRFYREFCKIRHLLV